MTQQSAPIVFFGSGPVAKASLDALLRHFEVEVVVTKPSTLHEMLAGTKDLCNYTVNNKSELTDLLSAKPFAARLGIIVDFGIIVEQAVIDYFPLGIINAHFSMLPEWRGADPISFAILSGQPETGVSLMLINAALDEGQLLAQETQPIDPEETTDSLTTKLVNLSADMLERYLPLYVAGKLHPFDQPDGTATYSRKLSKADGVIDWTKPAAVIEREIRAFQPWPKSSTTLGGLEVTISRAHVAATPEPLTMSYDTYKSLKPEDHPPGTVQLVGKSGLQVLTGSGALVIDELKPANGKNMPTAAFLAGHRQKFNKN